MQKRWHEILALITHTTLTSQRKDDRVTGLDENTRLKGV